MRLGFVLGFLIGAAVASVLSKAERQQERQTPEGEAPPPLPRTPGPGQPAQPHVMLDRVKERLREAKEAAKEAAAEKEAQMRREYEAALHRPRR